MSKLLVESISTPLRESGDEGVWLATLVTPGQGTSASYGEAALRESGPKAFKAGAHSYITHNRMENGEANPEKLWGVLSENAFYEDGVGLVGKIKVLPHWREFIEATAPYVALSIYAQGDVDDAGNLIQFEENAIDNGVDLVSYPGRSGSGLVQKMYESAIASAHEAENGTPSGDSRQTERNTSMEIAELAVKVDALTEAVSGLVTAQTALAEALKPAEPSEVDIVAAVDAVLEAKLPKASRTVVLEAIGSDSFDATLKAHKDLVESVRTELAEAKGQTVVNGRVVETASTSDDFSIGAWS